MLNEIGVALYDQTEGLGPSQFVFWTARQSYIDKHRAVLIDFMEDMLRIERWYLDPANHAAAAKIAGDLLKILGAIRGKFVDVRAAHRVRDLPAATSVTS